MTDSAWPIAPTLTVPYGNQAAMDELARLRTALADAEAREKRAWAEGRIEGLSRARDAAHARCRIVGARPDTSGPLDERSMVAVAMLDAIAICQDQERAALAEPEAPAEET